MEGEAAAAPPVAVVVVPFPAQGHLNQLLHLSRLLSERGLPVHFATSATHLRQAQLRVEGWDPLTASNLHLHPLPTPAFPSPPPDPNAASKFPDHLLPAFNASANLRQPLATLLRSLSTSAPRLAVVHDSLMSFATEEAASIPNAESFQLTCSSAYCTFCHRQDFAAMATTGAEPPTLQGCFTKGFWEFVASRWEGRATITPRFIFNTCRPIEAEYLDFLAKEDFLGPNIWAIGPLHPITTSSNAAASHLRHRCIDWLDKQPPDSVIYVSFGTMTSISDDQVRELALGLEQSEQRFVWALREADRGDIFAQTQGENGEEECHEERRFELPQGFEERMREKGVVVTDWAPQMEILGHPSVAGFMSHCGWNSCMESLSMGVAMATWPMHSDQPRNAVLVSEVLEVGVMVRDWARREEVVTAEVVAEVVKRLMADEDMRRRARELGGAIREVWAEGGSSRASLDSFISHIKGSSGRITD